MNNMDKFGFSKGIFILSEIDKNTNKKIQLVYDNNVIVNNSWLIVSGLLNGDNTKAISYLALGDGGVQNSVLQYPSVYDTRLFHEVYKDTKIHSVLIEKLIKPYYITFKFELQPNEGNGAGVAQIYSEAGLFSSDGTMFSRKTFDSVIKTPEKKFSIDWKLVYNI